MSMGWGKTEDIFEKIDGVKWSLFGFNPIFALKNSSTWRKYFSICVVAASCLWLIFGYDSVWSQLDPFTNYFTTVFIKDPITAVQNIPLLKLWKDSSLYYGVGNHFSAPVCYGLIFIVLSLHLEKVGIKRSLNFTTSALLSLLSIGVFEWAWNLLYATFQGQPWTITFAWKQIGNLTMFTLFVVFGALVLVYLSDKYKPNVGPRTIALSALAIIMWIAWIYYPLPVGRIQVRTSVGIWTNSPRFPQTYYAIDTNPNDALAIGTPYYVHDDVIHTLNTSTKVVTSLALLSFCMLEKRLQWYEKGVS